MNTRMQKQTLQPCAPHAFCLFRNRSTAHSFCHKHCGCDGPRQWPTAKSRVPRRGEERRREERIVEFCLKSHGDSQLSSSSLLPPPPSYFPSGLSISHTLPSFRFHPSDVGRCSYELENARRSQREEHKSTLPHLQTSLNIPRHALHLNLLYSTPLPKHHVNNPLTFTL